MDRILSAHTGANSSVSRPVVLFISPFIWEGGAHKGKPTVYYIMQGFLRAGYEVHVVTATNKPGLRESEFAGLHIHYFYIPFNPVKFKYDALESFLSLIRSEPNRLLRHLKFRLFWLQFVVFGFFKARSVAQAFPPTLVYGINNPAIPVSFLISRLFHTPTFSRIMGSPLGQWVMDNVVFSTAPDGEQIVHNCSAVSLFKLWISRFDELLAFKLPCEAVIITDDGTISTGTITDWLGVPKERVWLLRNGIDKAMFQESSDLPTARQSLHLSPESKVVLWVSQLVDWKHPERLLDAIPRIIAICPDVHFVIVGDGPERPALERRVIQLGIQSCVRFAGFVKRDELPVYFRSADVFTAFYDYANISNTLLEAMLSGVAVVVLNNGHTGDVVKHLENGWLVAPEQLADSIPEALIHVLTDEQLRQQLSSNAAIYAYTVLLTWDERITFEIAQIEAIVQANWFSR